ncbi:AAA family ATPase [Streptomyces longwoodensis]|uniref:AAA family ATPase n=1 Tax=Streptomyces longwoodensis TaxID=68231 RepID=UPI0033C895B8
MSTVRHNPGTRMFISAVYIRFFRSFNFDYLRKASDTFKPDPWDILDSDDLQYPFVKVPLEEGVTTVVGANESGKSQLLAAIQRALTGRHIERGDFCRYSQFFAVNKAMAYPDFGLRFERLQPSDRDAVLQACGKRKSEDFHTILMFRIGAEQPVIYLPEGSDGWSRHSVENTEPLENILPRSFEIDARTALPQSVPVEHLAGRQSALRIRSRSARRTFVRTIFDNADFFTSPEQLAVAGPSLTSAFSTANQPDDDHDKQLALADQLLLNVAKIDRTAFQELLTAVEEGKEGFANGIVERMNRQLAQSLNFPKWWTQDNQFQLQMTLRDQDLVFTIKDRTGTEYSANERSHGLKYFLSYFIQYLAHEPPASGQREVLLMDEPDAYLSGSGQQDLLRIFEDFAYPADTDRLSCQVVYVTHSPFLIDKNHGERIRVLEKGEGDEGTRVVRNASRNHYEPLRSAFGSFVGETTFIGNCNLMCEGMSDQILLAGMSTRLRRLKASSLEHLDLNTTTLVPAGSAPHVPYLVYLARGRDVDKPAVIVLLDADRSGDDARKKLRRGPSGKPLIDDAFVLQLNQLPAQHLTSPRPQGVVAIEDLIPLPVGVAAVKQYARAFLPPDDAKKLDDLQADDVAFDGDEGTHDALQRAAARKLDGFHLDKVGLARNILDVLTHDEDGLAEAVAALDTNFRVLFRELGNRQRKALREITTERTTSKIKRLRSSFLLDHPAGATREQATVLLEDIDASLDNSVDADDLRGQLLAVRRTFALDEEPRDPIEDFAAFQEALQKLAYRPVNAAQEQ